MMPKKIFYCSLFLVLALSNLSCSKWLTLQPQDGITQNDFWKTKEQVQSAVIGVYSSLLAGSLRPMSEYLFMWGETRADMVTTTLAASNDEQDIANVNTQPTNTVVNWTALYKTINYCNDIIKYAPGVMLVDNTLTQTQLNSWLSEVYTIRALMYFYLVRSFRDVPLKLAPTSSDTDLGMLFKSPADSVLKQVLNDLAFADSNAVFTYGSNIMNKGRITKYTVYSIEADVNLWMNNYDAAIFNCNKVISSGQFALVPNNGAWFTNLYYNGNSSEGIFEFQFDVQAQNNFYGIFLTGGRRYLAAGRVMDDMYTVDQVNADNKDIRGDGASVRTSDNAIWKYVSIDYNSPRASNASYAHWFVYRYADILLMKAEALNEQGNGADALSIITQIRRRANALPSSNPNPDPTDRHGMQDFLLAERGREFAFEGKRWYDLLRFAKRNAYERIDILLSLASKTASIDRQQSAIAKYKDPNTHYFPIYFNELLTDPNLVQNPYYK